VLLLCGSGCSMVRSKCGMRRCGMLNPTTRPHALDNDQSVPEGLT
jgi:hypothetical protein